MEEQLQKLIGEIRNTKGYLKNDTNLKNIISNLISKGYPYYKSQGQVTFSLDRTPIKTKIIFPKSPISLQSVVKTGIDLAESDLKSSENTLKDLLKNFELVNKDLVIEDDGNFINLKSLNPDYIESDPIEKPDDSGKTFLSSVFRTTSYVKNSVKLQVTKRSNFHLIGHLTQADLSFFSDFEEIKDHLSIINNNLVTMGNTKLVYSGYKFKLYDTMLLAPGG